MSVLSKTYLLDSSRFKICAFFFFFFNGFFFYRSPGKLAHDFTNSHLVFLYCLLDVVKASVTEHNENSNIICIYRDKKI